MSSNRLRFGRYSLVGQIYILTTRCTDNSRPFVDSRSANVIVDQIRRLDLHGSTRSLAWVVMPDHVHWMFQLQSHTLPYVARRFKSSCALALNRGTGRYGRVWQPGYFDHALRAEEALERHARYILANPVRAGMTERLGEYPHAWCMWDIED
jgi:putative transposase